MANSTSQPAGAGSNTQSPTLPLPPPRAVNFEDFVEAATRGVLRALDARNGGNQVELNPQPLPPSAEAVLAARIPGRPIIIGIIMDPTALE